MADTKLLKQQAEGKGAINEEVNSPSNREEKREGQPISETWAEDTIAELDDFIESQGIYLRQ